MHVAARDGLVEHAEAALSGALGARVLLHRRRRLRGLQLRQRQRLRGRLRLQLGRQGRLRLRVGDRLRLGGVVRRGLCVVGLRVRGGGGVGGGAAGVGVAAGHLLAVEDKEACAGAVAELVGRRGLACMHAPWVGGGVWGCVDDGVAGARGGRMMAMRW